MHRTAAMVPLSLLLVATICGVSAGQRPSAGGPSEEQSEEAKLLAKVEGLRAELRKSEVYRTLQKVLPRADIGGKTYYFAEGDLRVDDDQLLLYAANREAQGNKYERATKGLLTGSGQPLPNALLGTPGSDGRIARWPPGSTLNYCILKNTFDPTEYDLVVANLMRAAEDWANACNIKFEHKREFDSAPDSDGPPPDGVLFCVKKVNASSGLIASAFFPTSPKSQRKLLVFPYYFEQGMPYDRVGVFRHELGHILTFRHEHIRSEAPPVCATGEPLGGAIPLSAYDPRSVMHYFCPDGHVGSKTQAISDQDKLAAALVYPRPHPAGSMRDTAFTNLAP
jgi:hypothetical protein